MKTKSAIRRLLVATVAATAVLAASGVAAQVKERTLKFAFQNQTGHPQALGAQKFADLVAAKSDGKMKVKLFAGGVLGGDLQTVSALQGGTIELTVLNAGILSAQVKEFAAYDFPFLFNDGKEADAVTDGPFGQKLMAKLEDKGLYGLGYWDLGFRNLTNSRRPITRADDITGLKIRVIQSPIYIDVFSALGANATPLPFPELYPALEQKAVDGQENPNTTILSSKFSEVQKYITQTRHIYNPQALLISKKTWDSMSAEEKKILTQASNEATVFQRAASRGAADGALDALKKAGMTVSEISPEEMTKLRAKVKPVIDKYAASVGDTTVKELMAEVEKARK
ncbi:MULTISPECIES: TRAP transporter substrate-binding protein [Variovorax]|jgi:TRAP-type transport system periplasmic protein|uniref:TRAP transporter substrate-binding protein n=1 Tax=Variovorax TaxID=34072 RepID=UPI00086A3F4B|nr:MULTISPECIES: TRAP transporter substrate-binding protein [Variovorax]MBN8754656.1 TRAP transporter substrate-binding protein [Variovorax sp.]ODU19373.1 MAG: ABC transporter substrate-binding protein [Variovorax sp. SCN 67-85]ODV25274.1 MAG: ABC transporter substrate-binding protein [Variovorax sp. SCN 67-20]OJZ03093.1 MAG: ABC transporter substrate-binding protein [Variovorax sp. 67-131]UKI08176.1 TRAP transporter substrate-binding protein [Variovorax paradoxus]